MMRTSNRNRQLENYQRYLQKILNGQLKGVSPEISVAKLLSLFLAVKRKELGLHLHWNKLESLRLGIITVKDALAKNPTSKSEEHLQKAITQLSENNADAALKSILEAFEAKESEESEKQKARAKTPRIPNPINQRVIDMVGINPAITENDVSSRLGEEFTGDDKYFEYRDPSNPSRVKFITRSTIKNMVTKARKNLKNKNK